MTILSLFTYITISDMYAFLYAYNLNNMEGVGDTDDIHYAG